MLTEKEKGILDKTEDAIARKLDEVLESKEPIQDTTLSVVMDGVRILDRIRLMRGEDTSIQIVPGAWGNFPTEHHKRKSQSGHRW